MDNTIEGLLDAWTEYLRKKHGVEVYSDDIMEWDMSKAYPTLTKSEVYAPLFEEEMWQNVRPFDDAVTYLQKLISDGHEVVLVTASHYDAVGMKMRNVLNRYFPFIPYDDVIITSKRQMVVGDVLVDDAPHNLIGGKYKGILFSAPHNRGFCAEKYGMHRASNWAEVYQIIREMEDAELDELFKSLDDAEQDKEVVA